MAVHGRDRSKRDQLRHEVAAVVRELILSRKVEPGDALRLAPIARRMDISVTPVREALLLLVRDGWLAQDAHRGFFVLPTRRADVEDIYVMWREAERVQASRAAERATVADIAELRKIDSAMHEHDPDGRSSPDRSQRLNIELHTVIYRIADAPRLSWMVDAAKRLLPYELWSEIHRIPGWQHLNSDDHTAIIDSIERGDTELAGAQMAQHLDATSTLLLEWLDRKNFWDSGWSRESNSAEAS